MSNVKKVLRQKAALERLQQQLVSNTKTVKLETGLELRVPGFVNQDESIVINTETGEYMERAK
mgnify:CR=1 FL=1